MDENIEKKLGYRFTDRGLLRESFTHRSYLNENRSEKAKHNERLELLGDAVLGLIVTDHLFQAMPEAPEGELSQMRSLLVDAKRCTEYVKKLDIAEGLRLGRGEAKNSGRGRETILADLFEALIGAIYLDGGYTAAKNFFFSHFGDDLKAKPCENYKAQFQDYIQKRFNEQPSYVVEKDEGPDHDKAFHIGVFVGEKRWGRGRGTSKKEAEQKAAEDALRRI